MRARGAIAGVGALLAMAACGGDPVGGDTTGTRGSTSGTDTTTTVPAPAGTLTYTVARGDTLWSIANHFGTTVAALVEANAIPDPDVIQIGLVLRIPG